MRRGRRGRVAVKLEQRATSIRENAKQEQRQLFSAERQSAPPESSAELSPIYDDGFARRPGEIIARAAARRRNRS